MTKLDFEKIHPEIRKALIEKGGRDEQLINSQRMESLGGGKIRSKEPTPKWASHDHRGRKTTERL